MQRNCPMRPRLPRAIRACRADYEHKHGKHGSLGVCGSPARSQSPFLSFHVSCKSCGPRGELARSHRQCFSTARRCNNDRMVLKWNQCSGPASCVGWHAGRRDQCASAPALPAGYSRWQAPCRRAAAQTLQRLTQTRRTAPAAMSAARADGSPALSPSPSSAPCHARRQFPVGGWWKAQAWGAGRRPV